MILTNEERKNFIAYLVQDCDSDITIIKQMKEMKLAGAMSELTRRRETELSAKLIVLRLLQETESHTLH